MAKGNLQFGLAIDGDAAIRYVEQWTSDVRNQTKELSDQIQKALGGPPIKQVLEIITVTDENGIKKQVAQLKEVGRITDTINKQTVEANKLQEGSVTRLRQQVNQAKQARDAIAKIGVSADDLKTKVNSINPAWDLANQKVKSLSRELEIASASSFWQRIKAEFNLGPIVGAGKALNEIVNTFQSLSIVVGQLTAPIIALSNALNDIQQIQLLFKGIGAGPAEISKIFADSSSIALQYGVNLKTVRESFTQLTPVILASGGSLSNVSEITSALSSRFATFGLSADKSRRVMNGVIQAFGKGKLMAEELTQQISEADPAFKTDLANAIGVTVTKLGEMVKNGEITSQVLMDVLPLLAKSSDYFGKLGDSATSAVAALGRGQATIEQVKNQIATLTQLNLERLGRLFEPLLGAFLQVQAAVVDFVTNISQLEITKTFINVFNGLAQILAVVITGFTNLVVAILKIAEPIGAAINSFDNFTQAIGGVRLITTALAALLGVQLYNVVSGLATALIPKAIAQFAKLGISIQAVTIASLKELVVSIGNTIKSIGTYLVNVALTISGNQAMALSHSEVAAAATAQAAAQTAAAGAAGAATAGAAGTAAANTAVATSATTAATATAGFGASLAVAAPWLIAIGALLLGGAGLWNDYSERTKIAKQATEGFREDAKSINEEFAKYSASANQAINDTESFAQRLKELAAQGRKRGAFDFFIDVFFETDVKSAAAVRTLTNDLKKEFNSLKGGIDNARTALQNYNATQDASGKSAEYVKMQAQQQIKLLDALIQRSIQAREAELKRAAANGAGLRQDELIEFEKLGKEIEKFRKMRDDLIAETKAKGIKLDIEIATEGEEQAITTIAGLDAELKKIKESTTIATIGEQGTEETKNKIEGLDGLLKFIQDSPVVVQVKAQFDIDKEAISSQIAYAEAMIQNAQSRANLEDSIFGIYKARNSYAVSSAEEELQAMKKRKASAELIEQKENQIAQLKANDRAIEQAAIQKKIQSIGQEQALERQVLELKQIGQRLDAQAVISAAELVALRAREGREIAKANLIKAKATKDPTDDGPAQRLVEYANQYVDIADKGVSAAKARYGILLDTQALERDTLNNQQAATRNNLNAQAAQVGLNSAISQGIQAYSDLSQQSAGFITAGGKTVQLYTQFGNELRQTGQAANALGQELNSLPTDQALNVGVNANVNPQSIGQAVAEAQAALGQPANQLSAPLKPSVDTVSFYNEIRQAVQQVQSSDATKVSAQLVVNGQELAAASIDSLTNSVDEYRTRVEMAGQAQSQLQYAIGQYNEALQSGDPSRILEAAGALRYQKEVVQGANFDLQNSKQLLQEAGVYAQLFGVNIGTAGTQAAGTAQQINGIGQAVSTSAAEIGNYTSQVEGLTSGAAQAVQSVGVGLDGLNTEAQQFINTLSTAPQAFGEIGTAADQSAQGISGISENLSGLSESAEAAGGSFMSISTGAGEAAEAVETIPNSLEGVGDAVDGLAGSFSEAASSAGQVVQSGFDSAAENASVAGSNFSSSLQTASGQADEIYSTLSNIDNLSPTVTVTVTGIPGRFAGGPVDSGQMYRVNELGKEAFLSASGRLSMINKPKNALWRAPSRGTVIPAHLTAGLAIPSGGVSVAPGASRRVSSAVSNMSSSASIARAVTQALRASGLLETNNSAAVNQAGQAAQLGKLTHAVNKLVDKDWNVQVNVKNPSPSSYVNMINRLS